MLTLEEVAKVKEAMKGRDAEARPEARLERLGLVTEVKWRGTPW